MWSPLPLLAVALVALATGAPTDSPTAAPTAGPTGTDISVYFTLRFQNIKPTDIADTSVYTNAVAAALFVSNDRVASVGDGSQVRWDGGLDSEFEFRVFADNLNDVAALQGKIGNEQTGGKAALLNSVGTATDKSGEVSLQAKTLSAEVGVCEAVCVDNQQVTAAPTSSPSEAPAAVTKEPSGSPTSFPTPGRVRKDPDDGTSIYRPCRDDTGADGKDVVGDLNGKCGWYYMEAAVVIRGERLNDKTNGFLSAYPKQGSAEANGYGHPKKSYVDAFAAAVATQCNTTAQHVSIAHVAPKTTGSDTNTVGSKGHSYDSVDVTFGVSVATEEHANHCYKELSALEAYGQSASHDSATEFSHLQNHLETGATISYVHTAKHNHYFDFVQNFRDAASNNADAALRVEDREVTVQLVKQQCGGPGHWTTHENMDSIAWGDQTSLEGKKISAGTRNPDLPVFNSPVCMFADRVLDNPDVVEEHAGWTNEMIATGIVCTALGVLFVAVVTWCTTRPKRAPAAAGTKVNVAQSNV